MKAVNENKLWKRDANWQLSVYKSAATLTPRSRIAIVTNDMYKWYREENNSLSIFVSNSNCPEGGVYGQSVGKKA